MGAEQKSKRYVTLNDTSNEHLYPSHCILILDVTVSLASLNVFLTIHLTYLFYVQNANMICATVQR